MAEFCKECSINLFGQDFKELANLGGDDPITDEQLVDGWGFPVLCEGCGFIFVDNEGVRIDEK